MQGIHQSFKRQILVRIGIKQHTPYTPQHFTETRLPAQVCTQDQNINEKPYNIFSLRMRPIGNVCPYNNIPLSAIAVQQNLEGSQQDHKQRYPLPATESSYTRRKLRWQREGINSPIVVRNCRWCLVYGQFQRGDIFKLFCPILNMSIQHLLSQPLSLPECIISILDGQCRQR